MSRNLSQSSAWIFAGLGSLIIFGLILFWIMNIPRAHEGSRHQLDAAMRISSDAYEIPTDESLEEGVIESDTSGGEQTIRSDDLEEDLITPDDQSEIEPSTQQPLKFSAKQSLDSKKKIKS